MINIIFFRINGHILVIISRTKLARDKYLLDIKKDPWIILYRYLNIIHSGKIIWKRFINVTVYRNDHEYFNYNDAHKFTVMDKASFTFFICDVSLLQYSTGYICIYACVFMVEIFLFW